MASALQEYLKRYTSDAEKPKKKRKKLKSSKGKGTLTIVDADPVWQKDIKEDSSESEAEQGDAPVVIEDVEFKRMQRLESLRMRPYMAIAADGSGWVSVNETLKQGSLETSTRFENSSIQREQSASPRVMAHDEDVDSMPEKLTETEKKQSRQDTPDRDLGLAVDVAQYKNQSLSPERRDRDSEKRRHDTPERDLSPVRHITSVAKGHYGEDLSLVRREKGLEKRRHDTPPGDLSPPRRAAPVTKGRYDSKGHCGEDLSPVRREKGSEKRRHDTPPGDLSPPRRAVPVTKGRYDSHRSSPPRREENLDLSPPRRRQTGKGLDLSPPRRNQASRMVEHVADDNRDDDSESRGLRKHKKKEIMADGTTAGLQSARQLVETAEKKRQDEYRRFKEADTSISGRHAITVYRDKHGKRLESMDEILTLQQANEPKKEEKPLEWGRGLVQKREAEARLEELEAEKKKPFARTRDDPDLEKALKERVRWGDPMAHLVKNKIEDPALLDLGSNELMKESGFIVPQAIPKHSWLKRGVTAPPNRYGIKPGRHWDGVDRSTGYEKDMYKRQNEKAAERVEAYLWSVADM